VTPLFPGIPGGPEVVLVLLFIFVPLYVAYRVIKWMKHVIESAAGVE
jgi:hypothetical protein